MPHALVTGASGGVGLEVVRRLLAEGFTVTAQYRTSPGALTDAHLTWWQADFTDFTTFTTLPADLPDALDALIHCAGDAPIGTTAELPRSTWEQSMAINLLAPVELTAALLPALRAAGGHVVYVNSGAGLHSAPRWSAYSAAKHAARAWCDALRAEEPGITVTSVYPGRIATGMQVKVVEALGEEWDPSRYLTADEVAAQVVGALSSHVTDVSLRR